jgi:PhnB protein
MAQLNPYVRFNDSKCKEAMTFYKECIGGELTLQTIGETPMAKEMPADQQGKIMHAQLKGPGIELYASDMMRDVAKIGDNFALSINTESEAEGKAIFDKLSVGGEVFMPLEKTFWGAIFGVVTDKYGIEWMVNCQVEPMK